MYAALILDYGFAWLAVILGIFLLLKYLLRKSVQKTEGHRRHILSRVNQSWKYPHIILGFSLIVVGLVHGIYSSEKVLSINIGTFNWLITLCFGFTWLFKAVLRKKWLFLHRVLAVLFVVVLVWHIIDVGGINALRIISELSQRPQYPITEQQGNPENQSGDEQNNADNPNSEDNSSSEDSPNGKDNPNNQIELPYYFSFDSLEIPDGTYQGEANGYSPGLKVEVTVQNNQVTNVKILAHHELDSKYYQLPMQKIPEDIINQQTLDVDMVSGASMTSVGIIKAVRNALLGAMGG